MKTKKPVPRAFYILPNLFTTASLFTAFWSVVFSAQGHFIEAAYAITFSAVMDGIDGKVARLTGTASEFGVQYDSLADVVAFGLAPAFLVWQWHLHAFNRLGLGIAFLIVACAALRLARFNVSTAVASKKFFIGLPSPAAGCTIAFYILFAKHVPSWFLPYLPNVTLVLSAVVALLMVSRVRYFAFKEYGFLQTHGFRYMVALLLIFVCVLAAPTLLLFLILFAYIVSGLVYTFVVLPQRGRLGNAQKHEEEAKNHGEIPK